MENLYGFPDGISRDDDVSRAEEHARKFGPDIRREEVLRISPQPDEEPFVVETPSDEYESRGLILRLARPTSHLRSAISTTSRDVTYPTVSSVMAIFTGTSASQSCIEIWPNPVDHVAGAESLERIVFESGDSMDVVALGTAGGTGLAETLGIPPVGPHLLVDSDHNTAVDRIYAAGDVTGGNRQVGLC